MRTFTRILTLLLACMMLAAISPATAEEQTVTINFWHHYSAQSAENETLMNVLIPAFEAENPGIKVVSPAQMPFFRRGRNPSLSAGFE